MQPLVKGEGRASLGLEHTVGVTVGIYEHRNCRLLFVSALYRETGLRKEKTVYK